MHPQIAAQAQQHRVLGSVIGSAQPMQDQPRASELHHELNRLDGAFTALEARVFNLSDRLSPVSLPSSPSAAGSNCVSEMAGSAVGQAIQNVRFRVEALTAQLDSMADRLAV